MPFTQGGGCTDCKSIIGCRCEEDQKELEKYENDHPEIFDPNYNVLRDRPREWPPQTDKTVYKKIKKGF